MKMYFSGPLEAYIISFKRGACSCLPAINAELAAAYDIKSHILNYSKHATARELENRSIVGEREKKKEWKHREEERGRPIDCNFDLSAHTKPPLPLKKKKKSIPPLHGQGILLY